MRPPAYEDGSVRAYLGDVREVLREMPDESVHMCVTSPPYWNLRDYGTAAWEGGDPSCLHGVERWEGPKQTQGAQSGHASKADRLGRNECPCGAVRVDRQLGLEGTPAEFVAALVEVFREVRRVLRSDGTCWVNIGDSYISGPSGSRDPDRWPSQSRSNGGTGTQDKKRAGLKPKDLALIPHRLAIALQDDGWWIRQDVIWSKNNPLPESVGDRPSSSHEHVFLLAKSPNYFYDAEAVREPAVGANLHDLTGPGYRAPGQPPQTGNRGADSEPRGGRNRRSVWTIATEAYPAAHFATFPSALVEIPILAGTSARGCCSACGAQWRRQTESALVKSPVHGAGSVVGRHEESGQNGYDGAGMPRLNKIVRTTGWEPGCRCDAEVVPAVVLDPFAGSGTTLAVAKRLDRAAVGIELNPQYIGLIEQRCRREVAQMTLETLA